jgi:hypothetical protein
MRLDVVELSPGSAQHALSGIASHERLIAPSTAG